MKLRRKASLRNRDDDPSRPPRGFTPPGRSLYTSMHIRRPIWAKHLQESVHSSDQPVPATRIHGAGPPGTTSSYATRRSENCPGGRRKVRPMERLAFDTLSARVHSPTRPLNTPNGIRTRGRPLVVARFGFGKSAPLFGKTQRKDSPGFVPQSTWIPDDDKPQRSTGNVCLSGPNRTLPGAPTASVDEVPHPKAERGEETRADHVIRRSQSPKIPKRQAIMKQNAKCPHDSHTTGSTPEFPRCQSYGRRSSRPSNGSTDRMRKPRVRLLVTSLCFLLALAGSSANADLPSGTRSPFCRYSELAPYILTVTVTTTTCFVHEGQPWQNVTGHVLESIKGPYSKGESVEFGFPALACEGVSRISRYPFEMQTDDSFLVFLTKCGEFPLPRPASSRLVGRIYGERVHFSEPDTLLSLSIVLDTLRTLANRCDPAWLGLQSDIVLLANIESTNVLWPLDPLHAEGSIRIVPLELYKKSSRAHITLSQPLAVTLPDPERRDRRRFGTPILMAGSNAVLFLRTTETGQAELLPTVYSAWVITGSLATVSGVSPVCSSLQPSVIDARMLTTLRQSVE